MSSSIRPTTIVAASLGAAVAAFAGYAIYFDHKRRSDPEFRRALKRESRREARIAKVEAEAQNANRREQITRLLDEAREEGFPESAEEREEYFMVQVAQGEKLSQEDEVEAAMCFYRALKVYPAQNDLIAIYDKTVPKPVLDILAEMIAKDGSIRMSRGSRGGSETGSVHGIDD